VGDCRATCSRHQEDRELEKTPDLQPVALRGSALAALLSKIHREHQ
jgi:hypothetical protein